MKATGLPPVCLRFLVLKPGWSERTVPRQLPALTEIPETVTEPGMFVTAESVLEVPEAERAVAASVLVTVELVPPAVSGGRRPPKGSLRQNAVQFHACAVELRVRVLDAQVHVPVLQGGAQQPQGRWGAPVLGSEQRWSYSLPIAGSGRVELVSRWFESGSPVARDFQAAP